MFFVNELRKMTDRYALVQSNRRKTVTNKVFVAPVALENPKKPSLAGEVRRWLNLRILAWQGVRLATLHATMDFASIESETLALLSCPEVCMSIHWLLAGWRPDFLLHYTQYLSRARNFKIKGSTTDERKTAMMQAVAPRQRQGLRRLVALARTTTTDMLVLWGADLVHLEENLLRTFLAESLGSPYERKVASYYLSQQSPDRVPPQFRFLSLVVVPALGCALGFYVYYVCVLLTIGDRAAWLWALTLVLVLLLDALLLQPMCVLAGHVWIPGLVAPDISRKQYWLHRRCRLILQRTYGQIFSARNSLVQHLNPACRAARYYPQYPICRLLMSLTDAELLGGYNFTEKLSIAHTLLRWTTRTSLSLLVTLVHPIPRSIKAGLLEVLFLAPLLIALFFLYIGYSALAMPVLEGTALHYLYVLFFLAVFALWALVLGLIFTVDKAFFRTPPDYYRHDLDKAQLPVVGQNARLRKKAIARKTQGAAGAPTPRNNAFRDGNSLLRDKWKLEDLESGGGFSRSDTRGSGSDAKALTLGRRGKAGQLQQQKEKKKKAQAGAGAANDELLLFGLGEDSLPTLGGGSRELSMDGTAVSVLQLEGDDGKKKGKGRYTAYDPVRARSRIDTFERYNPGESASVATQMAHGQEGSIYSVPGQDQDALGNNNNPHSPSVLASGITGPKMVHITAPVDQDGSYGYEDGPDSRQSKPPLPTASGIAPLNAPERAFVQHQKAQPELMGWRRDTVRHQPGGSILDDSANALDSFSTLTLGPGEEGFSYVDAGNDTISGLGGLETGLQGTSRDGPRSLQGPSVATLPFVPGSSSFADSDYNYNAAGDSATGSGSVDYDYTQNTQTTTAADKARRGRSVRLKVHDAVVRGGALRIADSVEEAEARETRRMRSKRAARLQKEKELLDHSLPLSPQLARQRAEERARAEGALGGGLAAQGSVSLSLAEIYGGGGGESDGSIG
jgi:hypothetical protein